MPLPFIVRMRTLGLVAGASALVSCSDATGLFERSPVTLSLSARQTASASLSDASGTSRNLSPIGASSDLVVTANGHTLNLQAADLTLRDLRLARHDGSDEDGEDSDSDSDGRHSNDGVFRTGPMTIALPLDGAVVTPLTGELPFGRYDRLRADFEFLRLRGTYDGQPLDVTLAIRRKLSLALRPPLVIDADHRAENVTLNVNVFACFTDATGTPLDLRRVNRDAALRDAVHRCISRALRAYKDHDRDGADSDSDGD